jgi:hypothetical protein
MKADFASERQNKKTQSTKLYGARLKGRSKITNNGTLLPNVDGRSIWAGRLRDLIQLHVADYGGAENMSEAERSSVRRAATSTTELELLEVQFATVTSDSFAVRASAAGTASQRLEGSAQSGPCRVGCRAAPART